MSERHDHMSESELVQEYNLTGEEREQLDRIAAEFVDITDADVDVILSRYFESALELSPDVRASLRRAVRRYFGLTTTEEK